uniref:Secreted protein n=1 Tax=Steinernema glaseri TaxID=37863 RepID=A0A1I7ZWA1_9BILA
MKFVFLFVFSSVPHVLCGSRHENTILCRKGTPPEFYNATVAAYEQIQKDDSGCGPEAIIRLCRKAFKRLSCGIDLHEEVDSRVIPMTMKKFKCEAKVWTLNTKVRNMKLGQNLGTSYVEDLP